MSLLLAIRVPLSHNRAKEFHRAQIFWLIHPQAKRPLNMQLPKSVHPPPPVKPGVSDSSEQRPPSIDRYYSRINRYKFTEAEAFRPTSPGHSPGVGHKEPPSAP
ncbi:precursor of CEP4 [Tripterygium wilfordii]|uniref:precursor of CEP4 n=1 Tax=Tripterygium wilfordii TaxID=458696 RepID=UPI0018F82769|nr:precursor of CEP4 [Tripterygium wilfordii]